MDKLAQWIWITLQKWLQSMNLTIQCTSKRWKGSQHCNVSLPPHSANHHFFKPISTCFEWFVWLFWQSCLPGEETAASGVDVSLIVMSSQRALAKCIRTKSVECKGVHCTKIKLKVSILVPIVGVVVKQSTVTQIEEKLLFSMLPLFLINSPPAAQAYCSSYKSSITSLGKKNPAKPP